MDIWIFNQYVSTPDQPTTGAYFLAKAMVDRGHQVTLFPSSFNYYTRRDDRLSWWRLWRVDLHEGVRLIWVRTLPHNARLWRRALNMVSYFFSVLFVAIYRRQTPDVVIGTCPHQLSGLAAYLVSLIKGASFVFEIRDLWPQTFVDRGAFSQRHPIIRVLGVLERFLFERAALILTVLPGVADYVRAQGADASKVLWIPNGIDVSLFDSRIRHAAKTPRPFVYLGGHASYQGIDTILEAARLVQQRAPGAARFVFIGDGSAKESLVSLAERLGLETCEFRNAVPRRQVARELRSAFALLFHLRDLPVLKYGMSPNKLCDYMMSGRPIVYAAHSRNNPVEESKCGVCVPPENPPALADAILRMLDWSDAQADEIGARGEQYARERLDVRQLAQRFEVALAGIAG